MRMIINEGGINWEWFTILDIVPTGVKIILHDRFHKGEALPDYIQREQIIHPEYYHEQIWKEKGNRTAVAYNVPGIGWRKIINPKYIFGYLKQD